MYRTLRTRVRLAAVAVIVGAAALGACSSDQVAPVAPSLAKGGIRGRATSGQILFDTTGLTQVTALTRNAPLVGDYAGSALITPKDGGYFVIEAAGITVYAPPGAVADTLTIWARAIAGSGVVYEFGPHGTQFLQPVYILQNLRETTWPLIYEQAKMEVGYFKDPVQVDTASATAYVDELMPTLYSMNKNQVIFTVEHFSGYLLSTGRIAR